MITDVLKPLVYIAGPYTLPDPITNVRRAIEAAECVESFGATPFIPHLSLLWDLIAPAPIERWYDRDLDVLDHCQALVLIPGHSVGAEREVAVAHEDLHIPCFDYCTARDGVSHTIPAFRQWMESL